MAMRTNSIPLLLGCLCSSAAALQHPPTRPQPQPTTTRRAAVATFAAALLPAAAQADEPREGGALSATCLGFGCNPYGDLGFNGLPAEEAKPGSMVPQPNVLNRRHL